MRYTRYPENTSPPGRQGKPAKAAESDEWQMCLQMFSHAQHHFKI